MKRFFYFITTFTALFISLTAFSPASSGIAADVLNQTNEFRKSEGLTELISREDLDKIAQQHSDDMADGTVPFGHDGFAERSEMAKEKIKGMMGFAENVAYGATTGEQVVTMWKKSPPHRKNMLGNFKYIGIGVAKDKQGRIFYTEIFAG